MEKKKEAWIEGEMIYVDESNKKEEAEAAWVNLFEPNR